jgi:hypothetical protein
MAKLFNCLCIFALIAGIYSSTDNCPALLKQAGASPKFAERVVHAIHAITVTDLKKLEPKATVNNNVPTVNRDKESPIYVLPNAPDIRSVDEDKFNTTTMKLLDLILTHIDDRMYYESDYTLIEQIVHTAHMQDHRIQVKVHYDKLKQTRHTDDSELCACALDTKSNGIHDILVAAAQFARDRKVSNVDQGTLRYSRLDSHTKYSCDSLVGPGPRRAKRGIVGLNSCKPDPLRVVKAPNPDDCDAPVGPEAITLTGSGAWSMYKKRLHCLENQTYDSALFLYCALKQI